jgi:transcriptional antiterminator NusG
MSQSDNSLEPKWYVVHTYSGYENKVKTDLEKTIKNRELEDFFFNIVVPMEEQVEIKDGKRKTNLKKVFPGYVLVKMIVTEESWYIVRNTRGVTGFVGSGTDPIPLTDEEIRNMGFDDVPVNIDYDVNDNVRVMNGPLKNFIGVVQEINKEKHKVKVLVSMFGRETPVELEFSQVQKID